LLLSFSQATLPKRLARYFGSLAWLNKPLPIALLEKGCICRLHAERGLKESRVDCRIVCSSDSLIGVIDRVEAGLAVVALAKCSVPRHLKVVGRKGFPNLSDLRLCLLVPCVPKQNRAMC
jgi:DNA-binding transcriptional LysR family regulator